MQKRSKEDTKKLALPYKPRAIPRFTSRIFDLFNRAGAVDTVIYGGCLRDTDHNIRIRDCDAVVQIPFTDEDQRMNEGDDCEFYGPPAGYINATDRFFQALQRLNKHREMQFIPTGGMARSVSMSMKDGLKIDVKLHACALSLEEIFESATLGLSAIAMTRDQAVFVHPQYLSDRQAKTLTIFNPNHDDPSYIKKIRRKYPNYEILRLKTPKDLK